MPFESFVVSTYKLTRNEDMPFAHRHVEAKTGEEFREDVNAVYANVSELGGRVVTQEMTKLKVRFDNPDGNGGKGMSKPQDHVIILAELPHKDLGYS